MENLDLENENLLDKDLPVEEREEPEEPEDQAAQQEEAQEAESAENFEKTQAEKIAELERELAAARADFYNYRQRVMREKNETRKRVQGDVIIALLPVLDNLDRALWAQDKILDDNNYDNEKNEENVKNAKNILTGVKMVQQQFLSVLNDLGVSVIKTEGEVFNHNLHEAAGTFLVDEPELDGVIMSEQLRGYKSGDKVLRAARVTVGKFEN